MSKVIFLLLAVVSVCCGEEIIAPRPKPMPPIAMSNNLISKVLINDLGQTLVIWYDGIKIKAGLYQNDRGNWNVVDVVDTDKGVLALDATINNNGLVLVSYILERDSSQTLYAIFGDNGGASWDVAATKLASASQNEFFCRENLNTCLNDQNMALVGWKICLDGQNFIQTTTAFNKTWDNQIATAFQPTLCANNPYNISIKLDNNGNATAAWKMFVCGCYQIRATRSSDGGQSWSEPTTIAGIAVMPTREEN